MGFCGLILCRNVAFTYLAPPPQERVLRRTLDHLLSNGDLVIGIHERPPARETERIPSPAVPRIFERTAVPVSGGSTRSAY